VVCVGTNHKKILQKDKNVAGAGTKHNKQKTRTIETREIQYVVVNNYPACVS